MNKRGISATALTATAVLLCAVTAAEPATAAPSPLAVPRTLPSWTAQAHQIGAVADSAGVHARVYLAPRGGLAAVRQFAQAASTPGSAQYHQFLSSAQYTARFAPTSASVRAVSSYLRASGLKVTSVGSGNRYLQVAGTAAGARKAFGAQLRTFRHLGQTVQAPTKTLTVPANLRSAVLTITGLDTTSHKNTPATTPKAVPPPAGFYNARPCSLYYGAVKAKYQADFKTTLPAFQGKTLSYAPCGYVGPQLRSAYEGTTSLTGKGITVAITDAYASPTITSDANTYAVNHGDPAYTRGQYTQSLPKKFTDEGPDACDASGWYGEQTLDVEAVHAMAPQAKIAYYSAASCNDADFLDALAKVVTDNKAKLVSNSWGDLEANSSADSIAAYESVFLQGAAEGISFLFSSGDNGDELQSSGLKQADYPTSDPYVTSVGGTSTAIDADGKIAFQTGWGTDKYTLAADGKSWTPAGYLYGAGGGTSALFSRPAYQDGSVSGPYRQVPDVAMDADPTTGMLVGQTQVFPDGTHYGEYRIGGTSLASPLFAGITALALQKAGGAGAGLLNEAAYANKTAFTDVLPKPAEAGAVRVDYVNGLDASGGYKYTVRTFDQDSSLRTKKGYDTTTGIGAPNTSWLTALVRK